MSPIKDYKQNLQGKLKCQITSMQIVKLEGTQVTQDKSLGFKANMRSRYYPLSVCWFIPVLSK